ncbi:hypothetical protein [Rhodobacter sp. CZR27]|uniref:hypothetical protein n=1 Tax=Rhodobacter sp. CZR27 TaxID=2033869 RepID=UPI0012FDF90F|nr:hypothetical protein [Rhodobacter sp. CZR27]
MLISETFRCYLPLPDALGKAAAAPPAPVNLKTVNVFDPADVRHAALAASVGE